MSAGTLWNITVSIEGGVASFNPPPSKKNGYQFTKHARRGVMVFTLTSNDYIFTGCVFRPASGGMPGVAARWGGVVRSPNELVVSFDFPEGKIQEGDLRLEYLHVSSGKNGVLDPQVGNDGHTAG